MRVAEPDRSSEGIWNGASDTSYAFSRTLPYMFLLLLSARHFTIFYFTPTNFFIDYFKGSWRDLLLYLLWVLRSLPRPVSPTPMRCGLLHLAIVYYMTPGSVWSCARRLVTTHNLLDH